MTKRLKNGLFILFSLFTWAGFAQDWEVSGKVFDEEGLPLPGVSVSEDGTSNEAITDRDGEFDLDLSNDKEAILIFLI